MKRAVLFAAVLSLLGGCDSGPPPERVVQTFLTAANERDVSAMLRCVDPQQERMFRASFQVVEKLTRIPVENILDMMPGLMQLLPVQQSGGFRFSNVRIVEKRVVEGEATVTVALTVEETVRGVARSSLQTLEFRLRRFDAEGWRIIGTREAM
jgi:hypothetical protein